MVDNLDAKDYPFLKFIEEDKSKYKTATEAGYVDPDNLFLIGDSGGFLMNIDLKYKFVNIDELKVLVLLVYYVQMVLLKKLE